MISWLGSFSLLWFVTWFVLAAFFAFLYRFIRGYLEKSAPRDSAYFWLLWWSGPMVISFFVVLIQFIPHSSEVLVDAHCHGACDESGVASHVPLVSDALYAILGLLSLSLVFAYFSLKMFGYLQTIYRMRWMLSGFTKEKGESYGVIESENLLVFTLGWWQPKTYISRGLLTKGESRDIEVVLAHEHAHANRRDNLILLFGHVLTLFMLPGLAKRCREELRLYTEMACDEVAAKKFSEVVVAQAIFNVHKLVYKNSLGNMIEKRIRFLLMDQRVKKTDKVFVRSLILAVILGIFLSVSPLHHFYEWLIN